jgi:flagellar basal-body rod modification protein FlgD
MPTAIASAAGAASIADATRGAIGGAQLTTDHFLQLLVTQLQHQDPLDPMSNEDFLAQLAQFQSLQEQIQTAANTKGLLLGQELSAASGMIGMDVVVDGADGKEYVGRVEKVAVQDGEVLLIVGDHGISLDEIKEVRVPEAEGEEEVG